MTDKLIIQLFKRDKGKCFYCGVRVTLKFRRFLSPTCTEYNPQKAKELNVASMDHIYPKSRQGDDSIDNRVLCCYKCDVEKGQMSAFDFLAIKSLEKRK